jgi:hypothetical protein
VIPKTLHLEDGSRLQTMWDSSRSHQPVIMSRFEIGKRTTDENAELQE